MIFTGSWLISQFDWILYIFGAFLLFTGVKMASPMKMNQALATSRWCAGYAVICA
ncbi:putative pH-induced membrane-bound redox modulator [Escherichia coli]|nr:putative pH-induced membrane-bound redox modulator [Escherichia coli]